MCAAAAVQHNARTHTPDAHTLQTPKHRSHNQTMDGGVADTAVSPSVANSNTAVFRLHLQAVNRRIFGEERAWVTLGLWVSRVAK